MQQNLGDSSSKPAQLHAILVLWDRSYTKNRKPRKSENHRLELGLGIKEEKGERVVLR